MCLYFCVLHHFNNKWKSTHPGAFLHICSFFRRSIRENPHRRMQIRLDVNFHGFCIRLRRSYLRDSPLSKDFEKGDKSIFLQSKYFNRRGRRLDDPQLFQKNFAKPLTTAAGSAIIPLLPKTAGSGKSASFPAEECLIKLVLLSFFRYPSVLP